MVVSCSCDEFVAALEELDTSYESATRFSVTELDWGFSLSEERCSTVHKHRYRVVSDEDLVDACFLLSVNDVVIGGLSLKHHDWNRRSEIRHLYIDRRFRGQGHGKTLLDLADEQAQHRGSRELWLETQNMNVLAVKFYLSQGFKLCGLDVGLYDGVTDVALYLRRHLDASSD